jgi:hypothetical protein
MQAAVSRPSKGDRGPREQKNSIPKPTPQLWENADGYRTKLTRRVSGSPSTGHNLRAPGAGCRAGEVNLAANTRVRGAFPWTLGSPANGGYWRDVWLSLKPECLSGHHRFWRTVNWWSWTHRRHRGRSGIAAISPEFLIPTHRPRDVMVVSTRRQRHVYLLKLAGFRPDALMVRFYSDSLKNVTPSCSLTVEDWN